MTPLDFEILSRLMRYVFALLGVVIVWRTFAWLRRDRRDNHRRLRALPDAGAIGLLLVLKGSSELPEGTEIPVPPEGVMGFVRSCDVVVPVTDVVARHLDFSFRNGQGLFIYPRRGCQAAVDGVPLNSRADCRRYPMQHGSVLALGEALLQLGVFAGLDVQETPSLFREAPSAPQLVSPLPPWQDGPGPAPGGYPPHGYPLQGSMPTGYAPQEAPLDMPWQPLTPPQRRPEDEG